MNKDLNTTVTEYAHTLSDEEVRWLADRLSDRLSGDLAEALNFMSRNRRVDMILGGAGSANELYDLCDQITQVLETICEKRGLVKGPKAA